jgi:hypothetical protein
MLSWMDELVLNETGAISEQAGGDAESALESAARHLQASPRPAGMSAAREREILCRRQTRDLLAWARENNRLIASAAYRALAEAGGQEHRVWLDESSQLYFKATHPGRFGFSVIAGPGAAPELVAASPFEYLERLLLQNSLFGDRIRLEGIANEETGVVVITAQPNVTGGPVTNDEIIEFMRRLWFDLVPGLSLGNPGALSFYRDLDEVAAFDAHAGNFVKDLNGVVLPIDLILVRAHTALQAALARLME